MTKDKEHDDALIAEARMNIEKICPALKDEASTIAAEVLRLERGGWQPAPKPDRAEVLFNAVYPHCTIKYDPEAGIKACRKILDELRAEWEAERPAVVVPEETGWLVETKFGPHIHYMGIKDPHPDWRESRKKDEEFEPYGRRALVGLLSFNKDSNDGLRFARKVDAEAFIAAFGQLLVDAKATEHIWADKHLIDGAKGDE